MSPVGTTGGPPSEVTTPRMRPVSPLEELETVVLLQLNAPLSVRLRRKLNRSDVVLSAFVRYGHSSRAVVTGTSRSAPLIVSRTVIAVEPVSVMFATPIAARKSAPDRKSVGLG